MSSRWTLACRRIGIGARLTLAPDHGCRRQKTQTQACNFVSHDLLMMAANRRALSARGTGPISQFVFESFMAFSTGKLRMKSGANRTLMLVVEEGAPDLPFECAQPLSGCFVLSAFIYCLQLRHAIFALMPLFQSSCQLSPAARDGT